MVVGQRDMLYLQICDSGVNLRAGIVSYVITSMQEEGLGKVYRLAERLTCTNHKVIKKTCQQCGSYAYQYGSYVHHPYWTLDKSS